MNDHHPTNPTPAVSDPFDRFAADPYAMSTPAPAAASVPPAPSRRHGWLRHVLMCAPMLVVVAVLVATGSAGAGAIGYALLCVVMMGTMMLFMNHGTHAGHKH